MAYQLNPFQAVATANSYATGVCGTIGNGTIATRPYDFFDYYRTVFTLGEGGGSSFTPWTRTELYYPVAVTFDYLDPVPWLLYIPKATTNYGRLLAWPGRIKFCLSGNAAIGGAVGQYGDIERATESLATIWIYNYGEIDGPTCSASQTQGNLQIICSYEFTDDLDATVADYSWPGISNV